MKMKEVCIQTGLTERAVRFYVQEKLVVPLAQRRGGRTWLDFSPADVERLKAIATLRKAGFTIEEIRAMGADFSQNAPNAAFALRQRLCEAIESYERISHTDTAQADSLEEYAALLEREVIGTPLPRRDFRPASRLNWESILETMCMVLCVFGGWRLYALLWDVLSDVSFYFSVAAWNPLMVILPFAVLILPIALVAGSKAGKWLYQHFEYIP